MNKTNSEDVGGKPRRHSPVVRKRTKIAALVSKVRARRRKVKPPTAAAKAVVKKKKKSTRSRESITQPPAPVNGNHYTPPLGFVGELKKVLNGFSWRTIKQTVGAALEEGRNNLASLKSNAATPVSQQPLSPPFTPMVPLPKCPISSVANPSVSSYDNRMTYLARRLVDRLALASMMYDVDNGEYVIARPIDLGFTDATPRWVLFDKTRLAAYGLELCPIAKGYRILRFGEYPDFPEGTFLTIATEPLSNGSEGEVLFVIEYWKHGLGKEQWLQTGPAVSGGAFPLDRLYLFKKIA